MGGPLEASSAMFWVLGTAEAAGPVIGTHPLTQPWMVSNPVSSRKAQQRVSGWSACSLQLAALPPLQALSCGPHPFAACCAARSTVRRNLSLVLLKLRQARVCGRGHCLERFEPTFSWVSGAPSISRLHRCVLMSNPWAQAYFSGHDHHLEHLRVAKAPGLNYIISGAGSEVCGQSTSGSGFKFPWDRNTPARAI